MKKINTSVWLLRIAWILVIVLVIWVGYLNEIIKQQTKLYIRLEDRYVRVREQLGVEETQRLIDQSYLK